jgi:hypothetical protein
MKSIGATTESEMKIMAKTDGGFYPRKKFSIPRGWGGMTATDQMSHLEKPSADEFLKSPAKPREKRSIFRGNTSYLSAISP